GDEGVAPPVGEPGVAGDDRAVAAARDEIGVGGLVQRRAEAAAALALEAARVGGVLAGVVGAQAQRRLAGAELEAQLAGRGEVLLAVEAARRLVGVVEALVPVRIVAVDAVPLDDDRRDA